MTGDRYRPRVGHIQFLNSLPIYYGLVKNQSLPSIELFKGMPTELNRKLQSGEMDVSAISSIEYLRHHRDLLLLPDITISSDGAVKSITLVSKVPLAQLDRRAVALTSASATSHVLARIILERRYGVRPSYFTAQQDLGRMLDEGDAALLIGDPALRAQFMTTDLHIYDLGQEWKEHTGKAMVYAVWAVRRAFAVRVPELVQEVYLALRESLRYSLGRIDEVSQVAAHWESLSVDDLAAYFHCLRYEFGPVYQEGLLEFARQAQLVGELQEVPPLAFVQFGTQVLPQRGEADAR